MTSALGFLWNLLEMFLILNVFSPFFLRTKGPLSFSLFSLSWLVGDLVFHWLLLTTILHLLFAWIGAYHGAFYQGILFLTIIGEVALLVRFFSFSHLEMLVHLQMKKAFCHSSEIFEKFFPPPEKKKIWSSFRWSHYWNPFLLLRNKDYLRHADIIFHETEDTALKLDIYQPHHVTLNAPVLLEIHGGAWAFGSKLQAVPLLGEMAKKGWIGVSIEYRLFPYANFPDPLIDCKLAIAWIQKHIAEYGGNPKQVFVTGGSAGGHLAALVALTPNQPEYQPGFEECDTSVKGCVAWYGVYDLIAPFSTERSHPSMALLLRKWMKGTPATHPDLYRRASPIRLITPMSPPFLLIHGENDSVVPPLETEAFYVALKEQKISHIAHLRIPGVQHAFDELPTLPTQQVLSTVVQYLLFIQTLEGSPEVFS